MVFAIHVKARRLVNRIGLSPVSDVPRSAHEPVRHAPSLPVFVHIDDPDDVIVTMSRFDEIRDTFAGRAGPAGAANNDSSERGVQLKHVTGTTNSMPRVRLFQIRSAALICGHD
jgi:hypothetical protein